ncbi:C2H2-type zinc finger protein [Haloquadratum walsbyi]|nr:C2H2-type zinc finger protein [Haloquadratum walsbyi]
MTEHDCPDCERSFDSQMGLSVHYTQAHEGSLAGFECTIDGCQREFKRSTDRDDHVEQHHGPDGNGATCPTCDDTYATPRAVASHHATSHDESIAGYECPVQWCERSFEDRDQLQRHTTNHPDQESMTRCPTCGDVFDSRPGMRRHHYHTHGESLTDNAVYDCPMAWCTNSFTRRSDLTAHLSEHPTESGAVDYPTCERTFDGHAGLGVHFRATDHRPDLDQPTKERVIGLLLGDGCVGAQPDGKMHQFVICLLNQEFLKWLDEQLGWFSTGVSQSLSPDESAATKGLEQATDDPANYQTVYRLTSHTHPFCNQLRRRFYPNGEKRLPSDLSLTPELARMWYVSDGGLGHNYFTSGSATVRLHSVTYDLAAMAELFREHGFRPVVGQNLLRFNGSDADDLLEWMGSAPPGFEDNWKRASSTATTYGER